MKNHEFISIDGTDVTFSIDVSTPENEGMFFVSVPSLKIYSSAKSRNAIKLAVNTAIDSFLNYWVKRKNQQEFSDHLNQLGFTTDARSSAQIRQDPMLSMVNEPSVAYRTEKEMDAAGNTNTERFVYKTKLPR